MASGIRKLSRDAFMTLFDGSIHNQIEDAVSATKATFVVCFECVDMCSSNLGQRSALCVGPDCTFKSIEECDEKWINDLPSQRQYAQCYYEVDESMPSPRSYMIGCEWENEPGKQTVGPDRFETPDLARKAGNELEAHNRRHPAGWCGKLLRWAVRPSDKPATIFEDVKEGHLVTR